jgi:pilus assembly protein CpaF
MNDELTNLFSGEDKGSMRMFAILRDPQVTQVCINRHDRIFYWDHTGARVVNDMVFAGPAQYVAWLDQLLTLTDSGYQTVTDSKVSVIEASFRADATDVHGSIHISTPEVTRAEPALTIRKQPRTFVSLDDMMRQGMMSSEMRMFLQQIVHGRLNIVISGGSGAGKTTLARALSAFCDPVNRIVTVEEIDELHLADRLPNVVSLTAYRSRDAEGRLVRETTLDDLVRESLRMRSDRIWVGETRGKESASISRACLSGHDGSVTTVHADNGPQAVRQLVNYVMEAGLPETVARDMISRAFHIVIQVTREKMGRRVIREITELEPVLEGTQQRTIPLFQFDPASEAFYKVGRPSRRVTDALARYGVNYDDGSGMH